MRNLADIRLSYQYSSHHCKSLQPIFDTCQARIVIEIDCELHTPLSTQEIDTLNREMVHLFQTKVRKEGECQIRNIMIV